MPTGFLTPNTSCGARGAGGFTLIESLIASVVLAASVTAIATALNVSYANANRVDMDETAVSLARQLMAQLASLPYTNDTLPRDSVVEYDGYSDSFVPTGTGRAGGSIPVGRNRPFHRSVSLSYRQPPPGLPLDAAQVELIPSAVPTDMAVVTVRVTTDDGRVVELSQLFTNTVVE